MIDLKTKKIVILGCGSTGKCVSYYLDKFFKFDYKNLYVVDKLKEEKDFPTMKELINLGAHYVNFEIKRDNLDKLFKDKIGLSKKDIIIDLTTRTPTYTIILHCRKNQYFYINTSIESDDKGWTENMCDDSIFQQHVNIMDVISKTAHYGNVTNIIEYGMNPGLISTFIIFGIKDLAKKVLASASGPLAKKKNEELQKAYKSKNISKMAEILKIRTIHCSEIDTQVAKKGLKEKKFYNTWSCLGLIDEGLEPAEIVVGTHEKNIPFAMNNVNFAISQLAVIKGPGHKIKFTSYVPEKIDKNGNVKFTEIKGTCVHHGEGISMNRYIGRDDYSPTMHYAYCLNPLAEKCLNKFSESELIELSNKPEWKVMNVYDNDLEGNDNVGALFIMEDNPFKKTGKPWAYWTGTILGTDYTKGTLGDNYFGPTVIQVMAGVLSGVSYMVEHDDKGIIFGEDLDDKYVLRKAKKYLGVIYSGPVEGVKIKGYSMDKLKAS